MTDLVQKIREAVTHRAGCPLHTIDCEECRKWHPEEWLSQAADEIERLTHLHNLDHSLADQWQKKNEELLGLLENIKRLLGRSKEYVYQGRGLPELRAKFLAEIDKALATPAKEKK